MRLALAFAALILTAQSASATCWVGSIDESEQAYASALLHRMHPLGMRDLKHVGMAGERDLYIAAGADFTLFLTPEDGSMKEIGFVLDEPASAIETAKLVTATAFTLADLSGTAEATIEGQLHADWAKRAPNWNETFGRAVATFTRTDDGTVVKVGLLACT